MDENKKLDLNSQDLNLNLISLDRFEQLPQKKQDEDETRHLKKKKKNNQGKKSKKSTSLEDISSKLSKLSSPTTATTAETTPTAPSPNNHHVNATTKKVPIQPPKEQQMLLKEQARLMEQQAWLREQQARLKEQQARLKSQSPPFYSPIPPIAPPRINIPKFQTPTFYPSMVHPMIRSQPALYCLPKEQIQQIQLKKEKFQPLPIIDPKNLKQIVVERSYPIIAPREQLGQSTQNNGDKYKSFRLYNQNRELQKLNYVIPDMIMQTKYIPTIFPTTEMWFDQLNCLSRPRTHRNNHCIAIDCEMVGIGVKGKYSSLARVSIVNYYGEVILNKFVKPTREITDYRTQFSGITPELLTDANDFKQVQKEVENIMKDHIVVGQSIYFDFKALKTKHPEHLIRDTADYNVIFGLETEKGTTPSLKKLAKDILGINIQEGEHDSIEDARASMILYRHRQAEWEEYLKTNGFPRPKGCKICGSLSHVVKGCIYNKKNLKNEKLDNLNNNNIKNGNDMIDLDEYNRDPNTSKYYSCRYPTNNFNSYYTHVPFVPYAPVAYNYDVNRCTYS